MLNWLVEEKGIAPHIPVFDKSKRDDGTFSRSDFQYDPTSDVYHCPGGKRLGTSGTVHEGKTLLYRKQVRLRCMPTQTAMLPEGTITQGTARHPLARPRRCPVIRRHRGLRTIAARA
jgi:hypothetical protein